MAGFLTIQRFPKGLPDFFGMKASGDTPPSLASQIIPSVDVGPFYRVDRLRQAIFSTFGNITNPIGLFSPSQAVPPGEVWDVIGISVGGVCNAAGQAIAVAPAVYLPTSGNSQIVYTDCLYSLTGSAIGDPFLCGKHFDAGSLILPPGSQPGGYVLKTTPAASNFTVNQLVCTYYRYLI